MSRRQHSPQSAPRMLLTFATACILAFSGVPTAAVAESADALAAEDPLATSEQIVDEQTVVDEESTSPVAQNESEVSSNEVELTESTVEDAGESVTQGDALVVESEKEEGIQSTTSPTTIDIAEEVPLELVVQGASSGPTVTYNVTTYHSLDNSGDLWDAPRTSALHVNGDGYLERVEFVDGNLVVETISPSLLGIMSKQVVKASTYLPTGCDINNMVWGGFFSGASYNFVVTGQYNEDLEDDFPVIRVTKYSKNWSEALGHVELSANNLTNCDGIYAPFVQGSCVMTESNGLLHIRTSKENYDAHQSNMHVVVNEKTMAVTDSMAYRLNQKQTTYGYVSHSFAQRLAELNGTLYALDHGDAYPRALTIKKLGVKNDASAQGTVLSIAGDTMENKTGVTLGGFESSATHNTLLSSFASIDQSAFDSLSSTSARNAYVGVTPATPSTGTTLVQLTDYSSNGDTGADLTKLVKINDDRFLVLWSVMRCGNQASWEGTNQTGTLGYVFVDGEGQRLTDVAQMDGYLSDCEPVIYNDYVIWYAEDVQGDHTPVYYEIDCNEGTGSTPVKKGSVDANSAVVSCSSTETYTGDEICPEPTVITTEGTELANGADYAVSYSNNVNPGTASLTVMGINGYTGSQTVNFIIEKQEEPKEVALTSVTAPVAKTGLVYNGKAQTGVAAGTGYTLSGTVSATNAGSYTAKATLSSGYQWSDGTTSAKSINWSIAKASVAAPTAKTGLTYNGSAQTGVATGTGYTLSGTASATNAGSYKATATLSDSTNYQWTDGSSAAKSLSWTIAQRSIADSGVKVSSVATQAYTSKAITPAPTVKYGNTTLTKGTHYTLSYSNNKNAGTATIKIAGKGNFKGSRSITFKIVSPNISYRTHVQNVGNQAWRWNGAVSGTSGRALRLEGIWINLSNKPVSGSIQYRTHVQNIGWQSWRSDGAMSGTSGRSLRLEAIQIRLTGEMAKKYDVYYRVHAQNIGWMGWAKNGAQSGTAGYSYRLEAIQIVLVPKGASAPGATYKGIKQVKSYAFTQRK